MSQSPDTRRRAPAAERNREPILEVLQRVLPREGTVLEVASGTGQHACYFAEAFPGLVWQPSDASDDMRASIEAWRMHSGLPNIRPPLPLDVHDEWPIAQADAVVCINLIHVAPWSATVALVRGAARLLPTGGVLYLYGPYRLDGEHTAPSNASFDADLRARNPDWGIRDVHAVAELALEHGLHFEERVAMPANNFSLVFHRASE